MKILALITGADTLPLCLDAAAAASGALPDATIEALPLRQPEMVTVDGNGSRQGGEAEPLQAQAVRAAFLMWNLQASDRTPRVHWRAAEDGIGRSLGEETAGADLVILAHPSVTALQAALSKVKKPLLIVRDKGTAGRLSFRHIAISMSDIGAALDICAAQPFLHAAERLSVIHIADSGELAVPGYSLIAKGIPLTWHIAPRKAGRRLGVQIAAEASAIGADLLVYVHRQRASPAGETGQDLLSSARMPVLVSL